MADDGRSSYASLLSDPSLLAALAMLFAGIVGLQLVAPALPSVGAEFDVPDDRVGWLVTAFFAAAAVTLPVVGAIADTVGRRRVAIVSLALFGVAGIATPLADQFVELLALRALQGAAFPGLVPLSITVVGDLYSGTRGSMAQGLRISVSGLGAALVPTVAGALAGLVWYYPFLLTAVAFPALVVVILFLPETKAEADAESRNEDEAESDPGPLAYALAVARELRNQDLLVLVVGAFVAFFGRYAVVTFLPLFAVRELGEAPATGGLLLSLVGACRVIVPVFAGGVVAHTSPKRALLGAFAVTAGAIASFALVTDLLLAGVVTVTYGVAAALFLPVLNDAVTSMASVERRASVVNTMELGKIVAIGASPAAFGVVLGFSGFGAVFAIAGGLLGAYTLVASLVLDGNALPNEGTDSVPS